MGWIHLTLAMLDLFYYDYSKVENVLETIQAAYGQAPSVIVNAEHLVAGEEARNTLSV